MILWCKFCSEYRKYNSPDWDRCKYKKNHTMVPANERFNNEIDALKSKIAKARADKKKKRGKKGDGKKDVPDPNVHDSSMDADEYRLGTLMAIKNAIIDNYASDDSTAAALDATIRDGLHTRNGDAYFWLGGSSGWSLVRHDSAELMAAVSALHLRRYGSHTRDYYMRDAVADRARLLKSDPSKAAVAVGRRAVFVGNTLYVYLGSSRGSGSSSRRIYRVSADGHCLAKPYGPGNRVVLESRGDALPEPKSKSGQWLEWLCCLLRIEDASRPAFAAHVCHMFCTHCITPAMVFDDSDGKPGGKTTAAMLVRELVDPVGPDRAVMAAPMSVHDLEKALDSPVLALDYADRMSPEVGRCLAAAREGLVMPNGESHGHARIIVAGHINRWPGHSIRYDLPKLDAAEQQPRETLLAKMDAAKPHVLYEIFSTLSDAFKLPSSGNGGSTVSLHDLTQCVTNRWQECRKTKTRALSPRRVVPDAVPAAAGGARAPDAGA